jgi:stearoyl-CoA desaturase (delta-9 desaturase)
MQKLITWFRETDIDWVTFPFIVGYHVVLLVALPLYFAYRTPGVDLVLASLLLLTLSLLSITMGYHRLFSHRTYEAAGVVEWFLVFFGTATIQGSVVKWSHDHRLHHKHVDKEGDPYGTPKGFWHSHVLWMFAKPAPLRENLVADLLRDPVLRSQHRHYGIWAIVVNVVLTVGIGLAVGDLVGAFVIAFLLRLFLGHHSTWFINSIAHIWGSQPYSKEHSAVNNFIIALLTYGEGYHNYHHTFAGDYRNGVKWYHFDPSKHAIWLLSKVGLTRNLRRVSDLTIQRRLVVADRSLLLEHLQAVSANVSGLRQAGQDAMDEWRRRGHENAEHLVALAHEQVERLQARVEEASHAFNRRVAEVKEATDAYKAAKSAATREEIRLARARLKALREELRGEWRAWQRLCDDVLKLRPAAA